MPLQNCDNKTSWRIAATSCVWPDTLAANCRHLAGEVAEVGLYLLEGSACLAYGPEDLPSETYGLRYHVHLPLDLAWALGGQAAFEVASSLRDMVAHLTPWGFVLHPPQDHDALAVFIRAWQEAGYDPRDILLENTDETSPQEVLDLASGLGCGICFDLGHMLAAGAPLPEDEAALAAAVRMLHVYSPFSDEALPAGRTHVHRPLTGLPPAGRELLAWMLGHLRPETIVLEVFAPAHLTDSLAVLHDLTASLGDGA